MRNPLPAASARDQLSAVLRVLSRGSRVDAPTSVPRMLSEMLRTSLSSLRAVSRGSRVDAPTSVPRVLWEMLRSFPRSAPAYVHEGYRDLATPKLRVGDPAFDFELPRLDASDGVPRETGETVRLSSFCGSRPVALVFGSYT